MRKAGELLKQLMGKAANVDRAYASKVRNALPENQTLLRALGGSAIGDIQIPADLPKEFLKDAYVGAGGFMAANAGIRYGLPALGAVGVAKGVDSLYNMAAQTPVFGNNPADVSDPNLMVTYVN